MKNPLSETELLLAELKILYRSSSITYADAARELGVSLNTIKRYMSGALNLATLERLCHIAGTSISELSELARRKRRVALLTPEQEDALAGDQIMALTYYLLDGDWTPDDISQEFGFSSAQMVGYLTRLDRLGLIKLFPANRVIVRVKIPWNAIRSHHLLDVLKQQWMRAFVESKESSADLQWRLGVTRLSPESVAKVTRKFDTLVREVFLLTEEDRHLPPSQVNWYIVSAVLNKGLFIKGLDA